MEMGSRLRSSLLTFLVILRKRFKEMKAPHTSWLEAINWQLPAWRNGQLEAGTEKVHACRLCLSTSKNFQTGEEKCLVFYSIWVSLCLFRSGLWWNARHEWPQIPQRGSDFLWQRTSKVFEGCCWFSLLLGDFFFPSSDIPLFSSS